MDQLTDTTPEADALLVQLMRRTPVWRKWALMSQLNDMTRSLALGDLRRHYPQATPDELQRLLGAELAEKVYGPRPMFKESTDLV